MVDEIVQTVSRETLHREATPVGASTGAQPLVVAHLPQSVAVTPPRFHELSGDRRGLLGVVIARNGRRVLVPAFEFGVVVVQHQPESNIEDSKDVSDVAAVFEGGPTIVARARAHIFTVKGVTPRLGTLAHGVGDVGPRDSRGVEAALGATPLQNPGPILVVGVEGHPLRVSPPRRAWREWFATTPF